MDFFQVRARKFFGFRHGPAGASLPSRLSERQALFQPMARPTELHEPAVVRDAVDDRRRELVVREDGAPPAGLDVGGGYDAPPPVALGYQLAQRPRPVHVEGHVAELVRDQQPRLGHVGEQPVERPLASGHGRLCDRCSNSDVNGAHITARHLHSPYYASTTTSPKSAGASGARLRERPKAVIPASNVAPSSLEKFLTGDEAPLCAPDRRVRQDSSFHDAWSELPRQRARHHRSRRCRKQRRPGGRRPRGVTTA